MCTQGASTSTCVSDSANDTTSKLLAAGVSSCGIDLKKYETQRCQQPTALHMLGSAVVPSASSRDCVSTCAAVTLDVMSQTAHVCTTCAQTHKLHHVISYALHNSIAPDAVPHYCAHLAIADASNKELHEIASRSTHTAKHSMTSAL
jgi:hypothetical protein